MVGKEYEIYTYHDADARKIEEAIDAFLVMAEMLGYETHIIELTSYSKVAIFAKRDDDLYSIVQMKFNISENNVLINAEYKQKNVQIRDIPKTIQQMISKL
jgi:hypothetical protein